MTTIDEDDYLAHYGILRRSGRYPWGSGGTPAQRSKTFLDMVAELREKGMSETEIATGLGFKSTTEFRSNRSLANAELKAAKISQARRLKDKGMSNIEIGKKMNLNESSVRDLLRSGQAEKVGIIQTIANKLRELISPTSYLDVGAGVENHLGISQTKLRTAVSILKDEGYEVFNIQLDQLGTAPGNKTTYKLVAPKGHKARDAYQNLDRIRQVTEVSPNGGRTWYGMKKPLSLDSSRLKVNYKEDGGDKADGVIYVRRGVDDISLGKSRYAQVRIMVDGSHYIKGMAVYSDDLPDGVDLVFNTNKPKGTPLLGEKNNTVLKPISEDKDNPFGAVVDQIGERDKNGNLTKVTSVMNVVNEQGTWDTWSRSLSSQMLSKQSPILAKTQLDLAYQQKKDDLDEIMTLTNPAVKKRLLQSLADDADASAVHLKAASMPRQATHVIMPINSLKETEIYAPKFTSGERVVLIRHPHGGTFEIPELTVNNRNAEGKKLLGNDLDLDAVGINSEVAKRLSGADFDGDTVLVIPNNQGRIKSRPTLQSLKEFDPHYSYPGYEGMKKLEGDNLQRKMGEISNLITDMTIQKAPMTEIAKAVRHSMVIIDAEKHNLNWKQSEIDNSIATLRKKYQPDGGASTIVSRASAPLRINRRIPRPARDGGPIDPKTGKKVFVDTNESWVDAKGRTHFRKMEVRKLEYYDDAHKLSSGTPMEKLYADHSNRLKALANSARKEMLRTENIQYSPSANKAYKSVVQALDADLNIAYKNRPLERQAQAIANLQLQLRRQANPDLDADQVKKIKSQLLDEARRRTKADKSRIDLTPEKWAAIQAGAITNNKLNEILKYADIKQVRELATPRKPTVMTSIKQTRAKQMLAAGYSQAEVAEQLGVALSTLKSYISREGG